MTRGRPASLPASAVVTIGPEATVAEAAQLMRRNGVGSVVVQEPGRNLLGILTERDILARVAAQGIDPASAAVRDFMTTDVVTVPEGVPLETVGELMATRGVRHVPVIRDGQVVNVYSSRDLISHQVAKDRAMRAAAEQVAMLSTSLRSLDFDEVVQMVTREVPKIFGAERSVLVLSGQAAQGRTGQLVVSHRCRRTARQLAARQEAQGEGGSLEVRAEPLPSECEQDVPDESSILIPIRVSPDELAHEAKIAAAPGFLCMCGMSPEGPEQDILLYKARLVQEVLDYNLTHAWVYQQTRRQAMTDPLTGVGTRRVMEEQLEAEFARAQRYGRQFVVAILDVDYYKQVNDRLGHPAGDRILRELAACLASQKRETDVLARYGGDEFVLLMPETSQADAVRVMERIRRKVRQLEIPEGLQITVSCGLAEKPLGSGINPNELLRRADIALYQAKKRGRDRTETWDRVHLASQAVKPTENRRVQQLESRVVHLSAKSKEMFVQSVYGLAQALEARDPHMRSHSENVMRYSVGIAHTLRASRQETDVIRRAAMIHDIGKIGVPDSILRKPGRLTEEERRIMEEHPLIAVRILDQMRFLEREMAVVRHHHEHWDGRGYPSGLTGKAIPAGARVLSVADALDAITSDRVYRRGSSLAEAVAIISEASGRQFDPQVVNALKRWIAELERENGKAGALCPKDLLDSQKDCSLAA